MNKETEIDFIKLQKMRFIYNAIDSGWNVKKIDNNEMPLLSNVNTDIKSKPIRSKFCNFKCDCFFSHSVKNDNICVPNWIKPLGL